MIKKLRVKFIFVAMISIAAVLFGIIISINIANFINLNDIANVKLDLLSGNGGYFPEKEFFDMSEEREDGEKIPLPEQNRGPEDEKPPHVNSNGITAETPYETRYFAVYSNANGDITSVNTKNIASVNDESAIQYGEKIIAKNKNKGFLDSYKYRRVAIDGGSMILFLDCSRDLSYFYNFLLWSIIISFIGLGAVFLLVFVFSKIIIHPILESHEKQKRFITDAGHELKTPITVINACTEIIEMENGENEWSQSIKKQTERMASLTEHLVLLARMDEEHDHEMSEFSLSDTVRAITDQFKAVACAEKIQFDVKIEEGITFIGNEGEIRRLAILIIDNAMKYTSGYVCAELKSSGRQKELLVTNSVESIQKGKLDFFFDRFYRGDSSRSSKGGFGIGLSVAKAIVNAHKGRISARSDDGKSVILHVIF